MAPVQKKPSIAGSSRSVPPNTLRVHAIKQRDITKASGSRSKRIAGRSGASLTAIQVPVDEWHLAVWRKVQEVPRGRVTSYGDVARALGSENHSRHVGRALRALPSGDFKAKGPVPWWRVVNSAGQVAFRPDDIVDSGSRSHQQNRLAAEGISFAKAALGGSRIQGFSKLRWDFAPDAS
ncbi:unnamed protein product [Polarella glacialis]|uniref:Methylated-DNA-[protein]-cysteine S-methyltransferase DNA binding domain-containing protein n=1 Tax=Polarella glacialis TaxID=89957 RepID=A0A813H531_POLGL|nr:unnamed protein product [Polarella glacialis]|mmetsp:Transcript_76253/g.137596  ORF Transcript_76253/g.137596 Transcript_76253/m.137596 type:complete len:179 (-) Transcript_76253:140-676(-)